jgi:hypothetical protein
LDLPPAHDWAGRNNSISCGARAIWPTQSSTVHLQTAIILRPQHSYLFVHFQIYTEWCNRYLLKQQLPTIHDLTYEIREPKKLVQLVHAVSKFVWFNSRSAASNCGLSLNIYC